MDDLKFYELSASEMTALIKLGKLSITELIKSINQRIDKINPEVNAWVHLNHNQSIEKSKELERKIENKEKIGGLFGIPIGIKDIFNTKDFPTEMGSPIWKDFTPGNDARVVDHLQMSDAIILGKTETAEFAVHSLGKSKNPYDPKLSPGTSSSGSAIAVATYMVPVALGSQTGGSIIRPASYCGIYGFKPSFGLIPRTGMLKTTDTLDQVGYFTRTVQDLELIFNFIRTKGRDYPISETALNDEKRQTVKNRPWKIKFVKSPVWNQAETQAKIAIEDFVSKISKEDDFEVNEFVLPNEFSLAHEMHKIIYAKSLSYYFKKELIEKSLISEIFYEFASESLKINREKFENAVAYQAKITKLLDEKFKDFDIIISLSTASDAPLRNEDEKDDPSLIWNMCGNPTISMPVIKTNRNLPMGIQVTSRKYNDLLLLEFVKILRKRNLIPDGPYPKLKI
jgi:Asp-tRNA(Asn)/Glu-tRNA(Gln) amidotransferase A subunit family amidase